MVEELQYQYNNKNIPETQLQRQIRKAEANKEKQIERHEQQMEATINKDNLNRLADVPLKDMSWREASILSKIIEIKTEPKHYGDIRKTQNETDENRHDPNHNNDEKLERFNEAVQDINDLLQKIQQVPNIGKYPGVAEKLTKCNEIMDMLNKIGENGDLSDVNINKIMKSYTRPACCTDKSGKYVKKSCNDYKCITKDYVHMPKVDSGYTKAELREVRDDLNKVLQDLDHFDQL